jgi:signal transduction histidine kinase
MVVAAALEPTRGFIDARRHVESISLPAEPLWFAADPTRITQVVGNLRDNATKYTPRGGEISVTGYGECGEVVLRVRDTGIGISPEMVPRVGLPGIDGDEVGRRIRAALGSRVLLVALAAYGQERRSSEAGFDAHLVKPASDADLTRVLGRAAGGNG